ncbi:mitochondrial transcription rescue factor 1 isoform X2 [Callithrix jacchus]|uniref:mitochondrial transcription rescue factor 1 isoform X2 n=1 Tax=Callithrix jacchus TaxID=9483 RepID=UPI00159E1F7E|nr:mitochondrial transcription rescue factor 1 isoform X2 [Callithrix jacchus]
MCHISLNAEEEEEEEELDLLSQGWQRLKEICIKVEDAFYKGELRLNEEKLWKKSRTVKVGDTLDVLIGEDKEAGTETVMRILLKKVFEEKTESDKFRVLLRRWKNLKLPKKRMSK